MNFLIFFAAFLAVANSQQVILPGGCGNVELVKNFSVANYSGVWNEIYRYPTEFQFDGQCATATYTPNGVGVDVYNTMVINKFKYSINGTARLMDDANGEGKLGVTFPSTGNIDSDYWVLSTDYSNYSLVYSCTELGNGTKKLLSWILSRNKFLKPESIVALNPALEAAGLSWNSYVETLQTEAACRSLN